MSADMSKFTTSFRVRSYELDGLGHLNHAVFLNYFEQARFDALEAGGYAPALLSERGWGVHVVRIEVDYRRECRLGDQLTAHTAVERFRNSSMIIRQRLDATDGEPVAEARVVAVWVGSDGSPMRIPEAVRTALAPKDSDAP
jgi:YbgC/YbaW family acyl-CoA thioester hydrolase